jgi:hypothetical protein
MQNILAATLLCFLTVIIPEITALFKRFFYPGQNWNSGVKASAEHRLKP